MLQNTEKDSLANFPYLYTLILRVEKHFELKLPRKWQLFPSRITKMYKIWKLCRAIFSVFYKNSPPNVAIRLILTASF